MSNAQRHMITAIKTRYEASQVKIRRGKYNDYWLQVRVPTPRDYDRLILDKHLASDTEAEAVREAYSYAMNAEPIKRQNTAYRSVVGIGV